MIKLIIAFLVLTMSFLTAYADYVVFSAKQKNAEKKWRVSIGKNAQGEKGAATVTKSGAVVVFKTGNTGRCFFTMSLPAEGSWRNKKYNAIEVEYKCKNGFDKVELWPYVYDRINHKTYRYAVYVRDSVELRKQRFNKFWKRPNSPKLEYSNLKNITFAVFKNTEISISKITLLEGQRKLYLEDKNCSVKSVLNSSNVELQKNDKTGTYFLVIKNNKIAQRQLTLKIADDPQGPWQHCSISESRSQGVWRLSFKLKNKKSGKYFLRLSSDEKVLGDFAFYVYHLPSEDYSQIVLWPTPKEVKWSKGKFLLPPTLNAKFSGKGDSFPLELLTTKLQSRYGIEVTKDDEKASNLKLEYTDKKLGIDGFELKVGKGGFVLRANNARGMYYAVRTMLSLIRQSSMGDKQANSRIVKIKDWGDTPIRVFYHRIDTQCRTKIGVEAYKKLIYEQIAAGRYNLLVINCRGGIKYKSHPEISLSNAISQKALREIIDYARKHYIDVAPGGNSPGHADWIIASHPELQEETNRWALCMRHPDTLPLLYDIYGELIELFKPAKYFWLGGDEISWDTHKLPVEKHCKRCKGFAKNQLVLEHWTALAKFCARKGVRPILYDDMLSATWNGGGRYRIADILPKLPRNIIITTWGYGDSPVSPQKLIKLGFTPWSVTTTFGIPVYDSFLFKEKYYQGKGISEFINWPWCNFSHYNDRTMSDYTAPAIHTCADAVWNKLTAAGTGWLAVIERLGPFWMKNMAVPDWGCRKVGLEPYVLSDSKLRINVGAVPFLRGKGENHAAIIKKKVKGLYFLQSFAATSEQVKKLRKLSKLKKSPYGRIVGNYVIRYEDGEKVSIPIILGWNLHLEACGPRSRMLQGAECFVVQENKTAWSFAWKNPRPQTVITSVSLEEMKEGKTIWLGLTLVK